MASESRLDALVQVAGHASWQDLRALLAPYVADAELWDAVRREALNLQCYIEKGSGLEWWVESEVNRNRQGYGEDPRAAVDAWLKGAGK